MSQAAKYRRHSVRRKTHVCALHGDHRLSCDARAGYRSDDRIPTRVLCLLNGSVPLESTEFFIGFCIFVLGWIGAYIGYRLGT